MASPPGGQEKVPERRQQFVIALIAAGAALTGAFVGGGASYLSTRHQIDAEAEQSRAEYLRAERKSAYVEVLRLGWECLTLVGALSDGTPPQGTTKLERRARQEYQEASDRYFAVEHDMMSAAATLKLVGSSRVASHGDGVLDACFYYPGPEAESDADTSARLQRLTDELDDLLESARLDLEVD